jgi:beta-glucosidase/6-phospho-beta-glucosidase/beta-galactosidase
MIDCEYKKITFFNIPGTLDFIGLNHYTTNYVFPTDGGAPGLDGDKNTGGYADPEWEESAADWLRVVPWGFRKIVNWITKEYDRPPIYVTENGFADRDVDGVQDTGRVNYYRRYINELMKAVLLDNADVKAYTAWR